MCLSTTARLTVQPITTQGPYQVFAFHSIALFHFIPFVSPGLSMYLIVTYLRVLYLVVPDFRIPHNAPGGRRLTQLPRDNGSARKLERYDPVWCV
jgi:hypothetical protein